MTNLIALDIETSGLDPADASIQAIGLSSREGDEALVGDEDDVLRSLEARISATPGTVVLVTWNGEEFDLPFLRARADILGVPMSLELNPTSRVGKYGAPLFEGTWGGRRHVDIAPLFKDRAEAEGVRWSLKPVARAVLGAEPIEVDRRGESIAAMPRDELVAYVCSDTAITLRLAETVAGRLSADDESIRARKS